MKTLGILFSAILGVILLGTFAGGGYFGVKFVVDLLSVLDPQAAVITIALMMTLLCATLIYQDFALISQKESQAHTHLEKAYLYERMLLLWGAKLKGKTTSVDPSVEDELQQLTQLLTLRESPKVIKTYLELHALERTVGLHSSDIPSRFVTVQMEMRKDLGLSTQTLKAEDFLLLFLAEVKVAPESSKATQRQDLQPRVSLATNA